MGVPIADEGFERILAVRDNSGFRALEYVESKINSSITGAHHERLDSEPCYDH
jgi:hypothetical protein